MSKLFSPLAVPAVVQNILVESLLSIRPDIPGETLTPCAISDRRAESVNELAILATEHLRSAEFANGKIEAIAEIVAE